MNPVTGVYWCARPSKEGSIYCQILKLKQACTLTSACKVKPTVTFRLSLQNSPLGVGTLTFWHLCISSASTWSPRTVRGNTPPMIAVSKDWGSHDSHMTVMRHSWKVINRTQTSQASLDPSKHKHDIRGKSCDYLNETGNILEQITQLSLWMMEDGLTQRTLRQLDNSNYRMEGLCPILLNVLHHSQGKLVACSRVSLVSFIKSCDHCMACHVMW